MNEKRKKWWQHLPYGPLLVSGASQLGLWQWVGVGIATLLGFAFAGWAWLESQLALWAIALIFLGVALGALYGASLIQLMMFRRKQSRTIDKLVKIDREALASELENLSRKISALVGEYRGPMQEEWWKNATKESAQAVHQGMARIEGKLIEKYSDRHGTDVWMLIRRASKVIPLERSMIWRLQHGVRSEHDLFEICTVLATIADDIRYPKAPLPELDRVREGRQSKQISAD